MRIVKFTNRDRNEWNDFVSREPSFGLLQSWEWGEFKMKLGWKAFRIAVEQKGTIVAGAQMLVKPIIPGLGNIAYIPRGPIGNWLDTEIAPKLLSELHRITRHHKAIFLRIEPPLLHDLSICNFLQHHNFRASHYTNQPRTTLVVDLTQDLNDILKRMPRKTRYNIRYAAKKGVTVRVGSKADLPAFYDLIKITAKRRGFSPRNRNYYEYLWQAFADDEQFGLLMAYYQDKLLAVRTAYYFGSYGADIHAAASNEYRNLRPNYLLLWEAIKWAKSHGCHTYDLWGGIPDEVGQAVYEGKHPPESHRTDDLWGLYQFKRAFSKTVLFYVSAYDYVYSPLRYAIVTNNFINKDVIERVYVLMDSVR